MNTSLLDQYTVNRQPFGRGYSSPYNAVNQNKTSHCVAFAYASFLVRNLLLKYITEEESTILYNYYLSRMKCDPDKPINLYYIDLFIKELNDGPATVREHGDKIYIYDDYNGFIPRVEFNTFGIPLPPSTSVEISRALSTILIKIHGILLQNKEKFGITFLDKPITIQSIIGMPTSSPFVVSIQFLKDGANQTKLMDASKENGGAIMFENEDLNHQLPGTISSHAMCVRRIVQYQIDKGHYMYALELINSWGADWGVSYNNVGYFILTDAKFIQFMFYFNIIYTNATAGGISKNKLKRKKCKKRTQLRKKHKKRTQTRKKH